MEEGREIQKDRRIPQCKAFEVENIFFLISALMEGTWHCAAFFSVSLLVCVCICCPHTATHMVFVMSMWGRERRGARCMQQIKRSRGGTDKENISNGSMLLLNCSPWEEIIPRRARGDPAVRMRFIHRLTLHTHLRLYIQTSSLLQRDSKQFELVASVVQAIFYSAQCPVSFSVFVVSTFILILQ